MLLQIFVVKMLLVSSKTHISMYIASPTCYYFTTKHNLAFSLKTIKGLLKKALSTQLKTSLRYTN